MEYSYDANADLTAMPTGVLVVSLIIGIISLVACWKIYTKAGRPGWACIIPFYNNYKLFEIAGMNGWMFLLLYIPLVNVVMLCILCVKLAKAFGKGTGFGIGMILFPFIFFLILAFGSAEYQLNKQ